MQAKRQFLTQITNPQVFVNVSQRPPNAKGRDALGLSWILEFSNSWLLGCLLGLWVSTHQPRNDSSPTCLMIGPATAPGFAVKILIEQD